jgi:hypothetical protein
MHPKKSMSHIYPNRRRVSDYFVMQDAMTEMYALHVSILPTGRHVCGEVSSWRSESHLRRRALPNLPRSLIPSLPHFLGLVQTLLDKAVATAYLIGSSPRQRKLLLYRSMSVCRLGLSRQFINRKKICEHCR